MDVSGFESVSEWFAAARAAGLIFPLSMPHGLEVGMKELGLSFPETFDLFVKIGVIITAGNSFIYNLKGHKAFSNLSIAKDPVNDWRKNVA